jgi:hypothetical protein
MKVRQGRPIRTFQPSLRDYSDLRRPTQDYVLGYVQPSLRDSARLKPCPS